MRAVALLLLCCTSCAIGSIGPDGTLHGYAIGHAKLETCQHQSFLVGCDRIEGGALSTSIPEFLSTLAAVAGLAYLGSIAVP